MVTKSNLLYWQERFAFEVARAREVVWFYMLLLKAHPHECFAEDLKRADEQLQSARSRLATMRLILEN